jgi:hypothetical protein
VLNALQRVCRAASFLNSAHDTATAEVQLQPSQFNAMPVPACSWDHPCPPASCACSLMTCMWWVGRGQAKGRAQARGRRQPGYRGQRLGPCMDKAPALAAFQHCHSCAPLEARICMLHTLMNSSIDIHVFPLHSMLTQTQRAHVELNNPGARESTEHSFTTVVQRRGLSDGLSG